MSEKKPASKRGSRPACMEKEVARVAEFMEKLLDEKRPIAKPVLTRFLGAYLLKYPRPRKKSTQNGLSAVWVDNFYKKNPELKKRLDSYGKNVISLLGEVDWNVVNALEKEFIEFVSVVLTKEDIELFRLRVLEKEQSNKMAAKKTSVERRSRSESGKQRESADVPSTSGGLRGSKTLPPDNEEPSTSGISKQSSSSGSVLLPLKLQKKAKKHGETVTIEYQVQKEATADSSQAAETSPKQVKNAAEFGSAKKREAVKNTRSVMPVSPGLSPKKLRKKEPRTPVSSKERDDERASSKANTPAAVKKTAVVALTPVVPRVSTSGAALPTPPCSGKKLKQRAVPSDAVPQVPIVWEKGAPLEAFDVDGFYRAKIVEINDTHVTVHFDGWSKSRNKKFPRGSDLLRGMSINMKFKVHDKVVVRTPGHAEFYGYVYSTPFSGSHLQIYNVMAGRDQRVHHDHVTKMDEESWNRSVQKITNDKTKEKEAAEEAARVKKEAAGESGGGDSSNTPSSSSNDRGRSYQTGASSRRAKRTSIGKNEDALSSSFPTPAKRSRNSSAATSSTTTTKSKVATPESKKNTPSVEPKAANASDSTQMDTPPKKKQPKLVMACEDVLANGLSIKQVAEKYDLSEEKIVDAIDKTWGGVMKGDDSDVAKLDLMARNYLEETILHEYYNGWKFSNKCAVERVENHLRSRHVPVYYFFSRDLPMNRPTEQFIIAFRSQYKLPAADDDPFAEGTSDMERAKYLVQTVNREVKVSCTAKNEVFYLDEIRVALGKRKNFVYRKEQFSVDKNEEIIAVTLVGIDGSSYPPMLVFPAQANKSIKFKKKDEGKLMFADQDGNLSFQNIKNFLMHRVKYPGGSRNLVVICDTTLDTLEGNDHAGTFCRKVKFINMDPLLQDKFETRNQNFIGRLGLRWKNDILSQYLNKSDSINAFSLWDKYNHQFTSKAKKDSVRESFKLSGLFYTNEQVIEGHSWIEDLIRNQLENKPVLKGMKIKVTPKNAASTPPVVAPPDNEGDAMNSDDAATDQVSPEAEEAVVHQKPLTPIKINTASLNIQTPTDDEDDDVEEPPAIERHTFEDFVHDFPSSDDSLSASLKTKKTKKQTATAEDETYSGHIFKRGDRVSARWNDGAFYPAYVVEVISTVQCKVLFDDNRLKAQPMKNIRLRDESIETPLRIRKKDELKCEKRRQKYLPEIFGDGTPVSDNRKRAEKPSSSQAQEASTPSSAKPAGPKESLATRKSSRKKTNVNENPHRQGIKLKLQLNLSSTSTVNEQNDNNLNNEPKEPTTSSSVYKFKSVDGGGSEAEASQMILMGRMHDSDGAEGEEEAMESLDVSSASSFSSSPQSGGSNSADDDEIDENTFNIESDVDAEEYVAQSDEEADDDHRISDDSDEPKGSDRQTAATISSSSHKYKLGDQVVFCRNGSEDLSKVVALLPNLRYQLLTSEQKTVSTRQSRLKPLTEGDSDEITSTISRPQAIPSSPLLSAYPPPKKHHNFFDDKPSDQFKCADCPKQYRKQSQLDQHRKVVHKSPTKSNKDSAKKRPRSIVEAQDKTAVPDVVSPPSKRKRSRRPLQHNTQSPLLSPPHSSENTNQVVVDPTEAGTGSGEPQVTTTTTTTTVQPAAPSQTLNLTDQQLEATTAVAEKVDETSPPPPSDVATAASEKKPESPADSEHLLCECGDETNGGEMIQCDRCLVWKHYGCAGLSEEQYEQLAASDTEKFVCRTCRYPRGERQTQRLSWDMDLLVEGHVPSFRPDGTKPKEDTSATGGIKRSEFIAAYTVLINRDLELQGDLERLNRIKLRMQSRSDTVDQLYLLVNYLTNDNDCTSFTASYFPQDYLQNLSELTGVPVENLDVNAYKRRLDEMKTRRASFGRYNMDIAASYKGPPVNFVPNFQRGEVVQGLMKNLFYVYLRAHVADMCNSRQKDYVKNMKQLDEYSKIVVAAAAVGREGQEHAGEDRASINRRLAETIDRLRRFTETHSQST